WDVASGGKRAALDHGLGQMLWAVAFSPRGDRLAACGQGSWRNRAPRLAVWEVLEGAAKAGPGFRLLWRTRGAAGPGFGFSLAFSADGERLAWTASHRVRLWDVGTGHERPGPRTRPAGNILSLAFLPG